LKARPSSVWVFFLLILIWLNFCTFLSVFTSYCSVKMRLENWDLSDTFCPGLISKIVSILYNLLGDFCLTFFSTKFTSSTNSLAFVRLSSSSC
jgi:hypothetical protein